MLCEIRDRVALITLNRPEARNALSDQLTPALRRMIRQCGDDSSVGALLITGAGAAFCAGGDVKGMGSSSAKAETPIDERIADLRIKQRTLTGALAGLRKPTLAALPGPAAGARLALSVADDEGHHRAVGVESSAAAPHRRRGRSEGAAVLSPVTPASTSPVRSLPSMAV